MDTIKVITADQLRLVVDQKGFVEPLLAKDHLITVLLYLLKDIPGLYFKGGTALNKIFLNYARLSEDIDFTLTDEVEPIREQIENVIKESGLFKEITLDKRVDRFTRLIVGYLDPFGNEGSIFIDLNRKASLALTPEIHLIPHFYPDHIPSFSFSTLHQNELIAEKVRAAIERNKPRDHFDIYQIIKMQLPIDMALADAKCKESGGELDIIQMFHRANKLKVRWDKDVAPLLAKEVSFAEVMGTLAKHFKLNEEKEKKKKNMDEIRNSEGYQELLKNISSLIESLPPEVRAVMRKQDRLK